MFGKRAWPVKMGHVLLIFMILGEWAEEKTVWSNKRMMWLFGSSLLADFLCRRGHPKHSLYFFFITCLMIFSFVILY